MRMVLCCTIETLTQLLFSMCLLLEIYKQLALQKNTHSLANFIKNANFINGNFSAAAAVQCLRKFFAKSFSSFSPKLLKI